MMLWIKLSLRNAIRNVRRTILTAATIVVGIAMVVFSLAWIEGIFGDIITSYTASAGHIRVADSDFIDREVLQPLYENIVDANSVRAGILKVPGVVGVEPRIALGVAVTVGEELGENFAMAIGAEDSYYRDHLKAPELLVKGTWLTGGEHEVVLGSQIAERIHANLGQELLLLGQTQYGSMSPLTARVVGIVMGDGMLNNQVFLPLSEMQWMADLPGGSIELLVYTEDATPERVGEVTTNIGKLTEMEGLTAQPWFLRQPLATSLPVLQAMKGFLQVLIVFMTALAIFNTMSMSVLERTGEIGVMRAMGLSRAGAVGLFLVEAIAIGIAGGLGGALLGALPSWYLEVKGMHLPEDLVRKAGDSLPMKSVIYANLTPDIVVQGVLLGLVIAIVGAVLPALRAASIQPVSAMSARR